MFRAVDSKSNSSSAEHAEKNFPSICRLNTAFSWEDLGHSFHPACGSSDFSPENVENEENKKI